MNEGATSPNSEGSGGFFSWDRSQRSAEYQQQRQQQQDPGTAGLNGSYRTQGSHQPQMPQQPAAHPAPQQYDRTSSNDPSEATFASHSPTPFRPMPPREFSLGSNLRRMHPAMPLPTLPADVSSSRRVSGGNTSTGARNVGRGDILRGSGSSGSGSVDRNRSAPSAETESGTHDVHSDADTNTNQLETVRVPLSDDPKDSNRTSLYSRKTSSSMGRISEATEGSSSKSSASIKVYEGSGRGTPSLPSNKSSPSSQDKQSQPSPEEGMRPNKFRVGIPNKPTLRVDTSASAVPQSIDKAADTPMTVSTISPYETLKEAPSATATARFGKLLAECRELTETCGDDSVTLSTRSSEQKVDSSYRGSSRPESSYPTSSSLQETASSSGEQKPGFESSLQLRAQAAAAKTSSLEARRYAANPAALQREISTEGELKVSNLTMDSHLLSMRSSGLASSLNPDSRGSDFRPSALQQSALLQPFEEEELSKEPSVTVEDVEGTVSVPTKDSDGSVPYSQRQMRSNDNVSKSAVSDLSLGVDEMYGDMDMDLDIDEFDLERLLDRSNRSAPDDETASFNPAKWSGGVSDVSNSEREGEGKMVLEEVERKSPSPPSTKEGPSYGRTFQPSEETPPQTDGRAFKSPEDTATRYSWLSYTTNNDDSPEKTLAQRNSRMKVQVVPLSPREGQAPTSGHVRATSNAGSHLSTDYTTDDSQLLVGFGHRKRVAPPSEASSVSSSDSSSGSSSGSYESGSSSGSESSSSGEGSTSSSEESGELPGHVPASRDSVSDMVSELSFGGASALMALQSQKMRASLSPSRGRGDGVLSPRTLSSAPESSHLSPSPQGSSGVKPQDDVGAAVRRGISPGAFRRQLHAREGSASRDARHASTDAILEKLDEVSESNASFLDDITSVDSNNRAVRKFLSNPAPSSLGSSFASSSKDEAPAAAGVRSNRRRMRTQSSRNTSSQVSKELSIPEGKVASKIDRSDSTRSSNESNQRSHLSASSGSYYEGVVARAAAMSSSNKDPDGPGRGSMSSRSSRAPSSASSILQRRLAGSGVQKAGIKTRESVSSAASFHSARSEEDGHGKQPQLTPLQQGSGESPLENIPPSQRAHHELALSMLSGDDGHGKGELYEEFPTMSFDDDDNANEVLRQRSSSSNVVMPTDLETDARKPWKTAPKEKKAPSVSSAHSQEALARPKGNDMQQAIAEDDGGSDGMVSELRESKEALKQMGLYESVVDRHKVAGVHRSRSSNASSSSITEWDFTAAKASAANDNVDTRGDEKQPEADEQKPSRSSFKLLSNAAGEMAEQLRRSFASRQRTDSDVGGSLNSAGSDQNMADVLESLKAYQKSVGLDSGSDHGSQSASEESLSDDEGKPSRISSTAVEASTSKDLEHQFRKRHFASPDSVGEAGKPTASQRSASRGLLSYSAVDPEMNESDPAIAKEHSRRPNPFFDESSDEDSGLPATPLSIDDGDVSLEEDSGSAWVSEIRQWMQKERGKPRSRRFWIVLAAVLVCMFIVIGVAVSQSNKNAADGDPSNPAEKPPPSQTTAPPTQLPASPPNTIPNWVQVGGDLVGESPGDEAGFSVAVSENGRVIVGARRSAKDGLKNRGAARIFQFDSANGFYVPIHDIYGAAAGDQCGFSVSISQSGKRVAVGCLGHDDKNGQNSGQVQIFDENELSKTWTLVYALNGEADTSLFGASVSLSQDGSNLIVGAPYHSESEDMTRSGRSYVFREVSEGQWEEVGQPLRGTSTDDLFGWSVSFLPSAGSVVAVGAPHLEESSERSGYVKVFSYRRTGWELYGDPLRLNVPGDRFGFSVSLAGDGELKRLAVGAPGMDTNGEGSGLASVYTYDASVNWWQSGDDLLGDGWGENLGYAVSLTPDATRLVVGVPNKKVDGLPVGQLRVVDVQSSGALRSAGDIQGRDGEKFGVSVSLSHDGRLAYGGAPEANLVRSFGDLFG